MACEVLAACRLVLCAEGVEVRLEWGLRVDDDVLAAGQLDDQIRSKEPSLSVALTRLLDEVAVGEHARHLDDALELHLAPAAANVRVRSAVTRLPGLLTQALLPLVDGLEQLGDRAHLCHPLLFEQTGLFVEAVERLLDRLKPCVRQLEQRGLAIRERVARERLEVLLPLVLGTPDQRELVVAAADLPARPNPDDESAADDPADRCDVGGHEPRNGTHGVGRNRVGDGPKKNQPRRVRRPTGAECRIR